MKNYFKIIATILFVNFLTGCKHNQLDVDTSKVALDPIVFKRLDKDVFLLTAENCQLKMGEFEKSILHFICVIYPP